MMSANQSAVSYCMVRVDQTMRRAAIDRDDCPVSIFADGRPLPPAPLDVIAIVVARKPGEFKPTMMRRDL